MWKHAGRTFLYLFGLIAIFHIVDRIIYYFFEITDAFITIIVVGCIIAAWLVLNDRILQRFKKRGRYDDDI